MFGRKTKKDVVVVSTSKELQQAIKNKENVIEVQGDLAKKLKWTGQISSKKIVAVSGILAAVVATAPVSAPVSALVSMSCAGPLQAIVGGEVAAIIFASGVTISLLYALLKNYDVNVGMEKGDTKLYLNLKK